MYDDDNDQRQALGQPSLDILMLKMIVVQVYFFFMSLFVFFYISKTPFLSPPLYSLFFSICAICCVWSWFIFFVFLGPLMPISFDVYSSKPANVWVNHCLSDLCTDCCFFFKNLFFFSSKKEIKSAGTEKWNLCSPPGFSFTDAFIKESPPAANSLASHLKKKKKKTVEVTKALTHFKAPPPLLAANLEEKNVHNHTRRVCTRRMRAHARQAGRCGATDSTNRWPAAESMGVAP